MIFEKSNDAKVMESVLAEAEVGQTVTYDALSAAIGRDVRKHAIAALQTARRTLLREKRVVFDVERGVGLVRLDDSRVVKATEGDRLKIHRTARRSLVKLATVDFAGLSESDKKQHVTASTQFGVMAMFSHRDAAKKIETQAAGKSDRLPIGDTLKLFTE